MSLHRVLAAAVLALFLAGSRSAYPAPLQPPATTPSPQEKQDTSADAHEPAFPQEDGPLYDWIRSRMKLIPLYSLTPGVDYKKLRSAVDEAIPAADYHHRTFPDSPHHAEVTWMLADLLSYNSARYMAANVQKWRKDYGVAIPAEENARLLNEYTGRIRKLIDEALAANPAQELKAKLQDLQGDILLTEQELGKSVATYEKSLATDSTRRGADVTARKVAEIYLRLDEYDKGAEVCRKYLKKWPHSPLVPHFYYLLQESDYRSGHLEEGLAVWQNEFGPILTAGCAGKPLPETNGKAKPKEGEHDDAAAPTPGYVVPKEERFMYEHYVDRVPLFTGIFEFALGKKDAAIESLQGFMDQTASKDQSNMVLQAYRRDLALPLLTTLYSQVGKPAPAIDLGKNWLNPPEKGTKLEPRATMLLFCPLSRTSGPNGRYKLLIPTLAKIAADYWPRGVRLVWISSGRRNTPIADQAVETMRQLLSQNALACVAGLDGNLAGGVHHAYQTQVGTANLYIIDREGLIQWRIVDPMYWHEGLIRRMLDRVFPKESH